MIQWNERRGKDKEGMAEQNQNQDMQKPHKRRVRYKGTHPRTFEEKYKEREPEKYAETIEKVISKGSTPAGMHLSICVDEILEFLQIQPGQRGLDATLGYGGHSRRMLEKLEGSGHLIFTDPARPEGAGRHSGLWRPQPEDAGKAGGLRPSLWSGRGSH